MKGLQGSAFGHRYASDVALAVCTVVGALVYVFAAIRLPHPANGDPIGPSVFPSLIGLGLFGSGLLLFYETWKNRQVEATSIGHDPSTPKHYGLLGLMILWTAIYYFAFEPVGYLISTVLYLAPMLFYFNRNHWGTNIAVTLGFTVTTYVVFTKLLLVALPRGILSF